MTALLGDAAARAPRRPRPTRRSAAIFALKMTLLRARRSLVEVGRAPPRLARAASREGFQHIAAQSVTPLWSDRGLAEQAMQLGKVQNLRRAACALDGLVLAPGQVFSFWRHVGRATRRRGYVEGRMLREGCLVAAVGGGLCQLSNALYEAALAGDCRIVERHAHSHRVPGSAAALGRDATVAWNYVDLRFSAPRTMQLSVKLGARDLTVSLLAREASPARTGETVRPILAPALRDAASCGGCDQTHCYLHEAGGVALVDARAAFLVDEAWPEFADYLTAVRRRRDVLGAASLRRWSLPGFETVHEARFPGALRSLAWRLTPPQGARRRAADAGATERIARSLAAQLAPDVTEICVAQSLLPYLWRAGDLGGRRVSVLMTRLPMGVLQARLDAAFAAHPDRPTLADYRADPALAEAEAEALAAADRVVTPHAEIAALFGDRAVRLDWRRPPAAPPPRPGGIFTFPGPTVARKGAFELREAARRLGATVRPLGADLEGQGFWSGVTLDAASEAGFDGVCAVVQPALAEAAPRRLLAALAHGVPVIATPACGLHPQPGLILVPAGDVDALAAAMAACRGSR
jgi:VanW like protein